MIVLLLSGLWNTWAQVGAVAGLLGTLHGRLLLAKLLSSRMLALAAATVVCSRPSRGSRHIGRPAMRRLSRFVAAEAGLARSCSVWSPR